MTTATKTSHPTQRVYAVSKKTGADKPRWTEIGATWLDKDGKGFSIKLKSMLMQAEASNESKRRAKGRGDPGADGS